MAMTTINEGVPRVFLDTAVFIRANFDYKSARFKSLMTLASTGRIDVFLTELTLRRLRRTSEVVWMTRLRLYGQNRC